MRGNRERMTNPSLCTIISLPGETGQKLSGGAMERQIIKIDRELCNGCGLCVTACHEGAIALVDGKAELIRDDYCDGLGNCLPVCPTGAISFETRAAAPFDEEAVRKNMEKAGLNTPAAQESKREDKVPQPAFEARDSELVNFPVQLQLVAVNAAFFKGARLLVAADCAAYAHGDFHRRFMQNHVTLMGCPKLDEADYAQKLTRILMENDIRSLTIVRMEVPCCGGLERAAIKALQDCGKMIPWQRVTLSTKGDIIDQV